MIKRILTVTAASTALALGFLPAAQAGTNVPVHTSTGTGLTVGADMYHHA